MENETVHTELLKSFNELSRRIGDLERRLYELEVAATNINQ